MIEDLKPLFSKLLGFAKDNLNFEKPPRLFLRQDDNNAAAMLGKTAYYDPHNKSVTVYMTNRHPKDILRSLCHELVHHCQNERGDLSPEKMKSMSSNYAQENPHMRKMEEEAYLRGNMCFRDWEDGLSDKMQYRIKMVEQKFLKESKTMSTKVTRTHLEQRIKELLKQEILSEQKSEPKVSDRSKAAKADLGSKKEFNPPAAKKPAAKKPAEKGKKLTGRPKRYYDHLVKLKRDAKGPSRIIKDPEAWKKNHLSANPMGSGEVPDDFEKEEPKTKVADGAKAEKEEPKTKVADGAKALQEKFKYSDDMSAEEAKFILKNFVRHYMRSGQPIMKSGVTGKTSRLSVQQALELAHYAFFKNAPPEPAGVPGSGNPSPDVNLDSSLSEGGCGSSASPGVRPDSAKSKADCKHCSGKGCEHCEKSLEENEELEEAENHPLDIAKPFTGEPDADDFAALRAGAKTKKKKADESKIQTPEQEDTLYEQRFTPKNNRLFETLVEKWTK